MLDIIGTPESFPVVSLLSAAGSPIPADFQDIPYSPVLLLRAHFDVSITADPEYQSACETGFDAYFEEMVQWNEAGTDLVFIDCFSSCAEVISFVARGMIRDHCPSYWGVVSFSFSVGFVLGWLSALSLTDRALALVGLELLIVLVAHMQKAIL